MQSDEQVQEIPLSEICFDHETQIRVAVNEETIQRYFDIMVGEAGRDKFPPILLYRDQDGGLRISDGHHRVMAAKQRLFTSIRAIVRPGTKADAIWEAVKANSRNGLPLGRADVRRAIELVIAAWPDKSDQVVADEIGCSRDTVRRARPVPTCANAQVEKRVGKDGKARPVKRSAKSPVAATSKKTTPAPKTVAEPRAPVGEKKPVSQPSPSSTVPVNSPGKSETISLTDRQKSLRDLYPAPTFWGNDFVQDIVTVFPDWFLQRLGVDLFYESLRRQDDGESTLADFISRRFACSSDELQDRMMQEMLEDLFPDESVKKVMEVFTQEKAKYATDDDEEGDES